MPGESIICTWTTNLALATDAVARGAGLMRGARVTGAVPGDGHTTLRTTRGDVRGRWVVNAAGLGADHVDAEFGYHRFTVTPRRGELLVFDKLTRPMVPCIVLAVPSSRGKGVLVSPTIYGNVMVGPTSENLEDRTATGTSEEGFEFLLSKGRALMPSLFDEEVTATYAGLRAATEHDDYLIDVDAAARYVLVGGIRSTGLTSGMAIAEYVTGLLGDAGLDVSRALGSSRAAADAEPRRGRHPAVPGCRAHRRRPRIRPHRLLLRAGHRRRAPRRIPIAHSASRSRRAASSHPGDERPLPRVLLRRAHQGAAGCTR